jgi:hypothetical protein
VDPRRRRPLSSPAARARVSASASTLTAWACSLPAASARSAWISMMLPVRPCAIADPCNRFQQPERMVGPVLGQQHPCQHQVPPLAWVVRRVVRTQATLGRPLCGCRDVP